MGAKINIQRASRKDAKDIHEVMKRVHAQMDRKDLYVVDDLPYIEECTKNHGMVYKAVDLDGSIVGFLIVYVPQEEDGHMGKYVNMEKEEYHKTAYMDSIAVLPEYRGYELQKKLLSYAEEQEEMRMYRHLFATVSPDNPYSLHNFLSMGYEIVCRDRKYGGLERYILYKNQFQ